MKRILDTLALTLQALFIMSPIILSLVAAIFVEGAWASIAGAWAILALLTLAGWSGARSGGIIMDRKQAPR